jgi:hypothetical protein
MPSVQFFIQWLLSEYIAMPTISVATDIAGRLLSRICALPCFTRV